MTTVGELVLHFLDTLECAEVGCTTGDTSDNAACHGCGELTCGGLSDCCGCTSTCQPTTTEPHCTTSRSTADTCGQPCSRVEGETCYHTCYVKYLVAVLSVYLVGGFISGHIAGLTVCARYGQTLADVHQQVHVANLAHEVFQIALGHILLYGEIVKAQV